MADSITPNLNLTQPEVGASTDTWGTKLNADLGIIDSKAGPNGAWLVSSGGTGAIDAATARTNLGLGTISTQSAGAVSITGGTASGLAITSSTLDGTAVGATTASTVRATSVQVTSGAITFADGTSQATSASALNSPSVFNIAASGNVSGSPIFQTEKVDSTAGAITRILPSAVGITGHQITHIKVDSSANGVSYVTTGGQSIAGYGAAITNFRQFDGFTLQSDGAGWVQIG